MTEPPFQPPPGPPSYGQPPYGQPSYGQPSYQPPTQAGWNQPPPPPGWGPGPPMGPPYQPPPAKKGRTGLVLAIIAAVLVLAAAIVVPVVLLGGDDDQEGKDDQAGPDGTTTSSTEPAEPAEPAAPADLDDVQVYDDIQPGHVMIGETVPYEQTPPVGGMHWGEWLECGAYDEPVADENGVHDLEHGAVWITYDPSLAEEGVAALADQLPQNGIMSPYDDLPAPVVITVWGRQLELTGADDPRIPLFIEEFDDGVTAPEPFASCAGGTAVGPPTA